MLLLQSCGKETCEDWTLKPKPSKFGGVILHYTEKAPNSQWGDAQKAEEGAGEDCGYLSTGEQFPKHLCLRRWCQEHMSN